MNALDPPEESGLQTATNRTGTVASVDMVAFAVTQRRLHETIGASAVAMLQRQIHELVHRSLAQLPDADHHHVISEPGDGAIVLFDRAEDAHCFSFHIHVFAGEHNDQCSQRDAERWFRVGIATGQIDARQTPGEPTHYAGITITDSVRLEQKAPQGGMLVDRKTFAALSPETKKWYGEEESVQGKHSSETFFARRCHVTLQPERAEKATADPQPVIAPAIAPRRVGRRSFVASGSAAMVAAIGFTGWEERDRLYGMLHPLPTPRYVALLAWPPPSAASEPLLAAVIESIRARLVRAEADAGRQLLILDRYDLREAHAGAAQGADMTASAPELASELGANLILAVNLAAERSNLALELKVLDGSATRVFRQLRTQVDLPGKLNRVASDSAARLLGLPVVEIEFSDEQERERMPERARALYDEARKLARDVNGAKLDEALEVFQELLTGYPNYALGYSGLGGVYLAQFRKTREPEKLTVAKDNIEYALKLNPASERARLAKTQILLASGKAAEALKELTAILAADSQNTDAIYLKGRAYGQLVPPQHDTEEQTYRLLIQKRPNYWYAHNELGRVLYAEAKNEEALQEMKTAVALAPQATTALMNAGFMNFELKSDEVARQLFEKSIQIYPNATAYEYLGDIDFRNKRYPSALANYVLAEKLNPNDYYVLSALGDTYDELKRPQEMNAAYTKAGRLIVDALKIDGSSGTLWMLLALCEAKIGNKHAADNDMAIAEEHGATDVKSLFTKARTLAALGGRMIERRSSCFIAWIVSCRRRKWI